VAIIAHAPHEAAAAGRLGRQADRAASVGGILGGLITPGDSAGRRDTQIGATGGGRADPPKNVTDRNRTCVDALDRGHVL